MNFDIAVNGRPWKVAIEPAERAGRFTIVVKGRKRVVDASWIDAQTLSLIDGPTARDVRIDPRDGSLGVVLDGRVFEAVVAKRGRVPLSDPVAGNKAPDSFSGHHAVKSPMPGRVMRVLVAVGDRVTAGQPVVVVEAMKMENELRSPGDGVVTEVNVREGAAVDAGAALVVIE
jgi:biotin carboxyl carrier protein